MAAHRPQLRFAWSPLFVVNVLLHFLNGPVVSTSLGVWIFHVRTVRDFLVWGFWGAALSSVLGLLWLCTAPRRRRDEKKMRQTLGSSCTGQEFELARRAATGGPIPGDPRVRLAAARLATDRFEGTSKGYRRAPILFMIFFAGTYLVPEAIYAVIRHPQYWDNWPLMSFGWGMFATYFTSWRLRRQARRLQGPSIPAA